MAITAPELKDYQAQTLPTYQAQTDKIDSTYADKQAADAAALQSAYDANMADANAALAKIPAEYQKQANAASSTSAQNRAAFNEYAASSGLNSGVGGQAQLAMNNALQNNLTTIRTNQANAVSDAQLQITKLKSQYQDSIAAAQKENDYEQAAALLAEYQRQAQSVVDTAATQANEYYRAYQSQLANQQYGAEWNRTSDQSDYERSLAQAQTLGQYGDFSGYRALGYTDDQIASMQNYWNKINAPRPARKKNGGGPPTPAEVEASVKSYIKSGNYSMAIEASNDAYSSKYVNTKEFSKLQDSLKAAMGSDYRTPVIQP